MDKQRRLRQLPSHLSDYHVTLPPTLKPSTMAEEMLAVSNTSQSTSISHLQAFGMYTKPTTYIAATQSVTKSHALCSDSYQCYHSKIHIRCNVNLAGRRKHLVHDLACELSSKLLLTPKTILDVGPESNSRSASEDESEGSSIISG